MRGLPRVELRLERLRIGLRCTWAFHAREVRFERVTGDGIERVFPETYSFHADRHDPAELYLQIEDLWSNPRRLSPGAHRRDAEDATRRLLAALPGYLEQVLDRVAGSGAEARASEDAAVFAQLALRFLAEHRLAAEGVLRFTVAHLRKVALRALRTLVDARVRPASIEAYVRGELEARAPSDVGDIGFFYALAREDADALDRSLLGATERAYHRWVEEVCLDTSNQAFETEDSPFRERELEVRAVIASDSSGQVDRTKDLSVFLRRPCNRDCRRLLRKLETFLLRNYDVSLAAAMRHHAADLARERIRSERVLSYHSRLAYLGTLLVPAAPFVAAIFLYGESPSLFDVLVSAEVLLVMLGAVWFLVWKFMVRRDLALFHASIPRVAAGIIVGYLPVFLIDEVWDLAEQNLLPILSVCFLLGSTTLLYLYLEVQRQLGERRDAFGRALDIFLLGLNESAAFGIVTTTLLGPLMAGRNWGAGMGASVPELQTQLGPFVGELPRILGVGPIYAFPTAVLVMTFLAFFIGTFLQLLWEDLPITEPL